MQLYPDWQAIGAIGEIVGAAGVILSLIYVGLQVRADARARRAQTVHEQSAGFYDILKTLATHPDVAGLWLRGLRDFNALGAEGTVRFGALINQFVRTYEESHIQFVAGQMHPHVWKSRVTGLEEVLAYPGAQAWWAVRSHWFTPEFQKFVNSKIELARPPTLYESIMPGAQSAGSIAPSAIGVADKLEG